MTARSWFQRRRSWGKVSPSASRPPPNHLGVPSGPVCPGNVTAYPVTWPGLISLKRSRTSTPASRSSAKNPASSWACSAAAVTLFRRTARAITPCSGCPRRSSAGPAQRARSFGKVRSAASFPPPYQMIPPSFVVWPARPTAYPVTSPGLIVLRRLRTRTPACFSWAKNSRSELAPAAAAHTSRRRDTRDASLHPRRAACSVSARAGRLAAVRSAGAVDRSPAGLRRPGRPPAPGRSHSRSSPGARPGGPASPRYGCDPGRAGPRPTAPRTRPRWAQTRSGP